MDQRSVPLVQAQQLKGSSFLGCQPLKQPTLYGALAEVNCQLLYQLRFAKPRGSRQGVPVSDARQQPVGYELKTGEQI